MFVHKDGLHKDGSRSTRQNLGAGQPHYSAAAKSKVCQVEQSSTILPHEGTNAVHPASQLLMARRPFIRALILCPRRVPVAASPAEVIHYTWDFGCGLDARIEPQLADSRFTLYTTSFPNLLNRLSCDACARS